MQSKIGLRNGTKRLHPVEISVESYSGYRVNERPVRFRHAGKLHAVARVDAQWRTQNADFFRVVTTENYEYELFYDRENDNWFLYTSSVENQ